MDDCGNFKVEVSNESGDAAIAFKLDVLSKYSYCSFHKKLSMLFGDYFLCPQIKFGAEYNRNVRPSVRPLVRPFGFFF